VTAEEMGRSLEEDLSMHPTEGGQDFGTRKSCSPIDVVMQWGGAPTAQTAAFFLCEKLSIDPASCGWREPKKKSSANAQASDLSGFDLNEDGIAQAFTAKHRGLLRFDHHAGSWFHWNGQAWRREETKLAFSWARQVCRQLARESGADDKERKALAKAATAAAVERFAQADRVFAVTSETWDRDPFLLGTPSGTVQLKTGETRAPELTDYITKLAAVAPAATAECPMWLQFLKDATAGDVDLIAFLQQFCGYLLTGDTREHALMFVYGPGENGKSVLLNTISAILGDYCKTAAMDTFIVSQGDRHPTDLAMLKGARMVCASETEEGRAWAETRIKQLTGGDMISARFMRQDFFEYRPQFKLVVIGNHKPVLRNVDEAARRRFNIIPFVNKPPEPDRKLEAKLWAEWPAILRWMIEGCLDWQANGLVRPQVVISATAEYFGEQDTVHQWIEDCCTTGGLTVWDTTSNLFKSWSEYALANREKPGTTKWFSQVLLRHGCEPNKRVPGNHNARGWKRIQVKLVETSTQGKTRAADNEAPPPNPDDYGF
jgi:putative DNA primase/helicase